MEVIFFMLLLSCLKTCFSSLRYTDIKDPRVIGGKPTSIMKYPSMACLAKHYETGADFRGGASIISSHWVVTAAHCMMYFSAHDIRSRIAYVHSNSSYWDSNYEKHCIVKFHSHEKFIKGGYDYDIAVVKVLQPFSGKYEKPITISKGIRYKANGIAETVGWGTTDPRNRYLVVDLLRFVELSLIRFSTCSRMHGKEKVTKRMICTLTAGKDACINDSGGPLYQNNALIGIVSWGPFPCANMLKPGVFTRVSHFATWIHHKLEEQSKQGTGLTKRMNVKRSKILV